MERSMPSWSRNIEFMPEVHEAGPEEIPGDDCLVRALNDLVGRSPETISPEELERLQDFVKSGALGQHAELRCSCGAGCGCHWGNSILTVTEPSEGFNLDECAASRELSQEFTYTDQP